MKTIFTLLISFTLSIAYSQWSPLGLSELNALSISDITEHNGKVLAITFDGLTSQIQELGNQNPSWDLLSLPGLTALPVAVASTGEDLLMAGGFLGTGSVFKSLDDGLSFLPNEEGLPGGLFGFSTPLGLDVFEDGGFALLNLGSDGYFIQDITGDTWSKLEPPTALNGGTDPVSFIGETLLAYDNSGLGALYRSSDLGETWETVTTNLPEGFDLDILEPNQSLDQLLAAGGLPNGDGYGLFASDDFGTTWEQIDLGDLLGQDALGGLQEITAIFADGPLSFIALENDNILSPPDILKSVDGLDSFIEFAEGLPMDPIGSILGAKFLPVGEELLMALNVRDIYSTIIATGVSDLAQVDLKLFPNPATDEIQIQIDAQFETISILDITGKVMLTTTQNRIPVSHFGKGVYLAQIQGANGSVIGKVRFVKD